MSSLPDALLLMSRQSAEDVSPVVDALCHALLAPRPRPLYCPGRLGRLLPLLHRLCPRRLYAALIAAALRDTPPRGTRP